MGYNTDILDDENISAFAKLVYFALSKYSGKDGTCYPSFKTIAKLTGISVRSVIRAITELSELKWIAKQKRTTESGDADSNLYVLHRLGVMPDSHNVVAGSHDGYVTQTGRVMSEGHTNLIILNNNLNNATEEEKSILDYLPEINNYPFDANKDLYQAREWIKSYPVEHVLNELEKFNAWWRDKESTYKGKKNFRSSITNWLKKSKVEIKPVIKTQWLT